MRAAKGAGGGAERAATIDMNVVKPETEGFSSERLENFHALMQGTVDRKELPGAVTILARHGKVIDYRVYGFKDLESGAKLEKDSIFRDFSMTKPVTAVAMMILYEQGKWLPMDPISKYIPEFEAPESFQGCGCGREHGGGRAEACADDGRIDDAYGGIYLRIFWEHAGR